MNIHNTKLPSFTIITMALLIFFATAACERSSTSEPLRREIASPTEYESRETGEIETGGGVSDTPREPSLEDDSNGQDDNNGQEHMPNPGCWRGNVRCDNLVVNGGIYPVPAGFGRDDAIDNGYEPFVGPWVFGETIGIDRLSNPDSASLVFIANDRDTAVNDEYSREYHPKYTQGRYRFSFWHRESGGDTREWSVRLKIRDWWSPDINGNERGNMPADAKYCYVAYKTFNRPHGTGAGEWRQTSWEFAVPLDSSTWDDLKSVEYYGEKCRDGSGHAIEPYDPASIMPGGYAIVVDPGSPASKDSPEGMLEFDDFEIEKVDARVDIRRNQ